jgi:ammonia channel protein AmtB
VHLVGGIVGTLLIGLVARPRAPAASPACSTAADSTSCGARPSVRARFCSTRPSVQLSWP